MSVETIVKAPVNSGGDFLPPVADTHDLGSTSLEWKNLYLGDNAGAYLGVDQDGGLYFKTASIIADEEIAGVIEGTSDVLATAANSIYLFNITNDGDIHIVVSKGGNSYTAFLADASTGDTIVMAASGQSVDIYIAGTKELDISASAMAPGANDGLAIGISGTAFSDLFLASGAVINFDASDVTITHSANILEIGGGDLRMADAAGPAILNEAATNTNPTLIPNRADLDTGIGSQAAGNVSIIANGSEITRFLTSAVILFKKLDMNDNIVQVSAGYIQLKERTAPGAGSANEVRMYAVVDGGGLTDWALVFQGGTVTILGENGELTFDQAAIISTTSGDLTLSPAGNNVLPDANDGVALGAAGTAWSDLFLAEGGVINWDSGDLTLTQIGNVLAIDGGVLSQDDTTESTSATTGSIHTDGGVGIAKDLFVAGVIRHGVAGSLTIATGVVAVTKTFHTLVVEGGAGSGADSLATATGGANGDILILKTTTSGANDQVTVSNGTGNDTFILSGGADFVMDHIDDRLILIHNGTEWVEISRSSNS